MNRFKVTFSTCLLFSLAALLLGCASSPGPNATVSCNACSIVASPDRGNSTNDLVSVAVPGAGNAWAVGFYFDGNAVLHALIEHWNGSQWSVVASPDPGSLDASSHQYMLSGIAAVSPDDIWAVGSNSAEDSDALENALIEHWNGSQWSIVAAPKPFRSELLGVAAISTNDVWAVGDYVNRAGLREGLIEHWNGSRWSVVSGGNVGNAVSSLQAVTTVNSNDVWAVGEYTGNSTQGQGFIERWDGSHWSVISAPQEGQSSNLHSIAAVSADSVYAVGAYQDTPGKPQGIVEHALIEHWDGNGWSVVSGPALDGLSLVHLNGLAVVAPNDIWAVGTDQNTHHNAFMETLVEHWNGKQWLVVPGPNQGSDSELNAIASIPGSAHLWSVGRSGRDVAGRTFIIQYS